jgi:DNA-binding NarL/FixJ family response regulator
MLDGSWEICGEAANGQEAVTQALELKPDLILMDVSMPVMNCIDATRKIREAGLATKILMLSMHNSGEAAKLAEEAGADGCLIKSCGVDLLLKTIAAMMGGKG